MPPHDSALVTDIAAHQYTFRADPSVPFHSPASLLPANTSYSNSVHTHNTSPQDSKRDDGDGDADGKKGKGVNRVGRACNGCRKQKMRCEGADDPPCKRCRHAKIPCLFEKPMRDQGGPGEQGMERIRSLEQQVGAIQSTLTELVFTLKRDHSGTPRSAHPDNPGAAVSIASGSGSGAGRAQTPMNGAGGRGGYAPSAGESARSASVSSSSAASVSAVPPPPPQHQQGTYPSTPRQPPPQPSPTRLQFPPPDYPPPSNPPRLPPGSQVYPPPPPPPTTNHHHSHSHPPPVHPQQMYLPPVTIPTYPNHPGPSSAVAPSSTSERLPPLSVHLDSMHMPPPPTPTPGDVNARGAPQRTALASVSPTSVRRAPTASQPPLPTPPPAQPQPPTIQRSVNFSPELPPSTFHFHPASSLSNPPSAAGMLVPSSNVTSAYSSDDEGELSNHGLTAPLEVLRSMADYQEAGGAREGEGEGGEGERGDDAMEAQVGEEEVKPNVDDPPPTLALGIAKGLGLGKSKEKDRASREMTYDSQSPGPGAPGPTGAAAGSDGGSGYASGGTTDGRAGGAGEERPSKRRKLEKRAQRPYSYPDVVTKCLVSEQEARSLFKIFYDGCSKFLPVFEPEQDTFDVLHHRSPFCVDTICMVGAQVRDGGDAQSETTRILQEEVRMISSATLWVHVARREAVQAMILVAGWSTNGWLAGGHAVRMALELGMHKAWPRLCRRIKQGKMKNIIGSDDHDLVVCSRIWFCLYLFEHQISFGTGRPAILKEDESVRDCRLILQHPLSVEDDMRLVSTVELMVLRERLHNKLMPFDQPIQLRSFELIREGERDFSQWFQDWDANFAMRYPDYTFYRHSLLVQRFLSELFHNAVGLRGIRGVEDVARMPFEQMQLAIQSIKVAQSAMDICIRSIAYRDGFKYAPDYTHVTATFAASFLIRLARLFPNEANLNTICNDVEELANILSQVPATRYANTLRTMLRVAQKRKVLPIRQLTLNGDGAYGNGTGQAASSSAAAGASAGHEPKGQSYSPQDPPIPAGLPMLYPDGSFIEPALGGEPPLASIIMPVPHQPQEGMWPPDTSYSAFVPSGFGYQAMLAPVGPTEMDWNEIW